MAAETFEGPPVIIDLGLERGEPDGYGTPTHSTLPRWFPPALVAVLVLLCTGASAAAEPPALSEMLRLSVSPADPYTITDDGTLLVQTLGTLASFDLASGAMHWQSGTESPTYRLNTGAGLLLLRSAAGNLRGIPNTRAVAIDTGAVRWRLPDSVMTVAGSPTLLSVTPVRSYSGTGRRVQGSVDAVDPGTGRIRWSVPVPSTAVLMGVPGPGDEGGRMLLVHDNRTVAVHDLVTGRLLASGPLPPADYGPDNPVVSGGLILLRHLTPAGRMVSAFDPVTLQRRWTRPAGFAFGITSCGLLACLSGPDGVRAIDPADGSQRWFRPEWRSVQERGDRLIAFGTPAATDDPLGLADPATGVIGTDLRGWRVVGGDGRAGVLMTRAEDSGRRTMVAVAARGDAQPRIIGDLPTGAGDCQSVPGRLVCRSTSGDLVVWRYDPEG
ncbi:PQQ-binding-like beta-propeller repeat protein [Actinoplanes sp. N902-109]|uniref:outer membrane protein assembly factor BamB family protein n=1 Tax=Actinoplanes sp. (strain N902-109) TaxID=649831 RepID=UPI0012FC0509|nr:PQQ-binding-like beta-propeller repeat protein [Actinoplanes sp. N902-109]